MREWCVMSFTLTVNILFEKIVKMLICNLINKYIISRDAFGTNRN